MDISGTDCALARESISVDLDGELSELDLRRLDAHLRVCANCSAWAAHVTVATTQLREAPVEAPAAFAFELPRSGRTWRVGPAFAVAPVAALVASIAVFLGGSQHASPGSQRTTSTPQSSADISIGSAGQHRVFHAV